MVSAPAAVDNLDMEGQPIRRVMLVQRRVGDSGAGAPVRRFSLARVGPSTVSALGADRFARMEEIAGMDEGRPDARDGYPREDGQ